MNKLGIDEPLFFSTTIVEQKEVELDSDNQNLLIQKIANLLSSGDDNISYKKSMEKLEKKLRDEVGTNKTVGRPLNEVLGKIAYINNRRQQLSIYEQTKEEIENRKEYINNNLNTKINKLNLIKEIKKINEENNLKKEEIKINEKIKEEYNEKIINLKSKLKINNNIKPKKYNFINSAILFILLILNLIVINININKYIENSIIIITLIYLLINLFNYLKNKNKIKLNNKLENNKINNEIEVTERNKENQELKINKLSEELNNKINNDKNLIINKYQKINNSEINLEEINNLLNFNLETINNKIELLEKELSDEKIELNTINIEEKNILNNIEEKANYEEELEYLEEERDELLSLQNSINIAKEGLEEAYNKMKSELTPKFTKDLSKLAEEIFNSKYKNVRFNDEEGLMVELENGEYINANRLSIGTIDELYLSLRISAMMNISKETMPIILDEAFVYYDGERLKNILKYLDNNYKNNQIIIFSCSNREKEIMNKENIEYNLIEL